MRIGWVVLFGSVLSAACGGPLPEEPSGQEAPGEEPALGFDTEDAVAPGQDEVSAEWNRPKPQLGPAFLVKDIVPGTDYRMGLPENLVNLRGRLYFLVTTGGESALWRSDGTAPGTVSLVRLPSTDFFGDRIRELTVVGDRLFFVAHSDELWVSDGTASGTRRVMDLSEGGGGFAFLRSLTAVSDTLFFLRSVSPEGGAGHTELWSSDGTSSGTVRVRDLGDSLPLYLTALRGKLFFAYDDGVHGREPWVSDGSAVGTRLVKDINPGPAGSLPSSVTPGDCELYFTAEEPGHGRELWKTDGTARGTKLIADVVRGPENSEVTPFRVFKGRLYFTMRDDAHRTLRLMKVKVGDSHHHRPVFLAELLGGSSPIPYTSTSSIESTLVTGGRLFISVERFFDPVPVAADTWVTNGTPGGTRYLGTSSRVREQPPGEPFAAVGDGRIVFSVMDEAHGQELWESDGTVKGTRLLQDIVPGPGSSFPSAFTRSEGFIFFVADTPETGSELWALPLLRGSGAH